MKIRKSERVRGGQRHVWRAAAIFGAAVLLAWCNPMVSCNCQDEMMEKERLISNIEDAVAITGLKIMGGSKDSIIVREGSIDADFEIRVSQLAG